MKIFKWNLIDDYDKMCLQNGVVREYKKRLEILEKEDYFKTIKLTEAKKEIERLRNELYKYEVQNSKLQRELVEERINNGKNIIIGEYIK